VDESGTLCLTKERQWHLLVDKPSYDLLQNPLDSQVKRWIVKKGPPTSVENEAFRRIVFGMARYLAPQKSQKASSARR
jgi:hypothetical protein